MFMTFFCIIVCNFFRAIPRAFKFHTLLLQFLVWGGVLGSQKFPGPGKHLRVTDVRVYGTGTLVDDTSIGGKGGLQHVPDAFCTQARLRATPCARTKVPDTLVDHFQECEV